MPTRPEFKALSTFVYPPKEGEERAPLPAGWTDNTDIDEIEDNSINLNELLARAGVSNAALVDASMDIKLVTNSGGEAVLIFSGTNGVDDHIKSNYHTARNEPGPNQRIAARLGEAFSKLVSEKNLVGYATPSPRQQGSQTRCAPCPPSARVPQRPRQKYR